MKKLNYHKRRFTKKTVYLKSILKRKPFVIDIETSSLNFTLYNPELSKIITEIGLRITQDMIKKSPYKNIIICPDENM